MEVPHKLKEISRKVLEDGQSISLSPRELINFYRWQRRGRNINWHVRRDLEKLGITTEPDFETSFIDGVVSIIVNKPKEDVQKNDLDHQDGADVQIITGGVPSDPVARIRMLESANKKPVSVTPDDEITKAVTIMMMNDFSQLPVMTNERTVKGMVSWRSIGRARTLKRPSTYVRDCMEEAYEIRDDLPLLDAIDVVMKNEVVLIIGGDKKITGIVTNSDLAGQFRSLAAPFLLIGEIENHVRRIIGDKFSKEELNSLRSNQNNCQEINEIADLTFGEYVRIMQNKEYWQRLNLELDRTEFCRALDAAREIRNEIMHFSPEEISEDDVLKLNDLVKFFQHIWVSDSQK